MAAWPSMRWVALAYRDDLVMGAYAERQMAETIVHAKIKMHGACATGVERPRRDTYTYSFGMRFPARTPHARTRPRDTERQSRISRTQKSCQCIHRSQCESDTTTTHRSQTSVCVVQRCSSSRVASCARAGRGRGGKTQPGPRSQQERDMMRGSGTARGRGCAAVSVLFSTLVRCALRGRRRRAKS